MIAKKIKTPLSGKVKINEIQLVKSVKIRLLRIIEVIMHCILVVQSRNCEFVKANVSIKCTAHICTV